jgi:tripartite-type tricarboxylate transporter receptor subunit TctC
LAAADGYTLYMPATSVFIVMPEMFPNLPFDLDRDFVRIGFVAEQPMLLAVAPSLGVNSLADLIALAKARPGQILYAANARGTLPHLTAERFAKEAGIELRFVPYAGAAAGLQDLMGGRISMIVESLGPFLGAIQGGSLKALAVASAQRLPNFPDVPTVGETIPDFIATGWFPLLAPAGTPDWIVRKVSEDLRAVLDQPAVRQRLADLGTFARPMSGAETTEFIRREQELWRPVVKQIGVSQ